MFQFVFLCCFIIDFLMFSVALFSLFSGAVQGAASRRWAEELGPARRGGYGRAGAGGGCLRGWGVSHFICCSKRVSDVFSTICLRCFSTFFQLFHYYSFRCFSIFFQRFSTIVSDVSTLFFQCFGTIVSNVLVLSFSMFLFFVFTSFFYLFH